MDRSSNCDDNSELDYHPSSEEQIDRSNTDVGCSTLSGDSFDYCRTISEISSYSEPIEEHINSDERPSISSYSEPIEEHITSDERPSIGWPIAKFVTHSPVILKKLGMKQRSYVLDEKVDDQEAFDSGLEIMKERFSKLLLGEDMSGGGKGVNTAVAISNAITNLYASVFGQFGRLQPMSPGKISMWTREMDCLLSVCDYIVEFVPSLQTLPNGSTLEVMESRPRADIYINLPALQKLDTMLLEILESFHDTEFWYIDEGNVSPNTNILGSFRRIIHRNEEKWWLPVPCVPPCGLSEKSRKGMQHKRECTNQIYKAAMAINSSILSEMGVPETYLLGLPKSGRASIGDSVYHYMFTADQFSPDYLLDFLGIKSEHEALEIADRVEASMYVWQRKASTQYSKSSWDMVKDLMVGDKNEILASRAENLLLCLKQRYPGLSQTTLDSCKIQYNQDVGQAILESYSRVLESLAFNIVARIDDVLHIDGSVKKHVQ